MASEQPRLPGETHQSLLSRGSVYMPLQAGEVSEFNRRRQPAWRLILEGLASIAFMIVMGLLAIAGASLP